MSNSNHSAKFINMLIALMASIAIALTCIVPTALAEDGDGTDDNNGGSTVQPAGPVPNIIITNFTYGDGSVAVGTNFDLGFTFQNMMALAFSTWLLKNSPKLRIYMRHLPASTTVAQPVTTRSLWRSFARSTAARISPFPAVRTRSITIRCGRAIP